MSLRAEMTWSSAGASAQTKPIQGRPARVVVLGRWDGQLATEHVREHHERTARPMTLDLDHFDERMTHAVPVVHTAVGPVSAAGFEAMHPDELVQRVPLLQQLMALRRQLRDPLQFDAAARIVRAWQGMPGEPAVSPVAPVSTGAHARSAASVEDDIERLLGRPASCVASTASAPADPTALVLEQWVRRMVAPNLAPQAPAQSEALIQVVNQALSAALTGLLHDSAWQAFESLWRGADWLLRRLDAEQLAAITLVDMSWAELTEDAQAGRISPALALALQGVDDDESPVLTHVVVHEPIALDGAAIATLRALLGHVRPSGAQVLACPHLQQFFDRQAALEPHSQAAWDACRTEAGDALQMIAPRFVLRQPYGPGSDPLSWLDYSEPLGNTQGDALLWGHPAWLVLADALGGGSGVVSDLPHVVIDQQDGAGSRLVTTEWSLNITLAGMLGQFGVRAVMAHASRPAVQLT